jgi:hypothetical protein
MNCITARDLAETRLAKMRIKIITITGSFESGSKMIKYPLGIIFEDSWSELDSYQIGTLLERKLVLTKFLS